MWPSLSACCCCLLRLIGQGGTRKRRKRRRTYVGWWLGRQGWICQIFSYSMCGTVLHTHYTKQWKALCIPNVFLPSFAPLPMPLPATYTIHTPFPHAMPTIPAPFPLHTSPYPIHTHRTPPLPPPPHLPYTCPHTPTTTTTCHGITGSGRLWLGVSGVA